MKITMVISSLGAGGAERVLVGIANHWQAAGHRVTIITYVGGESFYPLVAGVVHRALPADRVVYGLIGLPVRALSFVRRIARLRQAIIQTAPDKIVSFVDKTNVLTLLACSGLSYDIVISERTNPRYYPIGHIQSLLRQWLYRHAKVLVIQTRSLLDWAAGYVRPEQIAVIPNALDQARVQAIVQAIQSAGQQTVTLPVWGKRIIAMGRLSAEKGHDLLLTACAPVLQQYPDWGLEIIGDGPLRARLQQLSHELGIADRVHFYGQLKHPFEVMAGADVYVLPSRVEGFPNALLEAMGLGLPVVSFDCPSGPSDLIAHGENGLLVAPEDVAQMSQALVSLIQDEALRQRLGTHARYVLDSYAEERIMHRWDEVLN